MRFIELFYIKIKLDNHVQQAVIVAATCSQGLLPISTENKINS